MAGKTDASKLKSTGCTCLRLRKASRRVTQIYDHSLGEAGITVNQFSLLGYLARLDGISIGALAQIMIMDPTTLTRNLRPLERQGFIAGRLDPDDKRSRLLHLTVAGRETLERAKPAWARAQRHIERALGELDTPALNAALDRVLDKLAT